ncbi:zinc finger CCCH domain-containing protein 19-like [Panicum miliaceum]|uniref:Zinc finger CCCH domain-containing protein 19-like n=1 Tax=Panicum miliaceum TaxID=4540 RepID=A0A3L6QGL9_PANMI|nr:zinc finger CCCH domain-containing protein 19-like [Panicum miliaceum]
MDSAARPDEEEARRRRSTDCIYFLASPLTCKKGSECEFRHSDAARMNPRDCWYWFNGNCANPKCSFRHPPLDNLLGAPTTPRAPQQPAPQVSVPAQAHGCIPAKQGVPCYYFQKGMCAKGDRCAFSHGSQPAGNPAPQPPPAAKIFAPALQPNSQLKNSWTKPNTSGQQNTPAGIPDKSKLSTHDAKPVQKQHVTSRVDHSSRTYQNHSNSYVQSGTTKHYQPQPSVQDGLNENGMEAGEFVREPSAGSGVLVGGVDDDSEQSFKGNRSSYHHHTSHGGYEPERSYRSSAERLSSDKRISEQEPMPAVIAGSSDLRHRLLKQRRLNNNLGSTGAPDMNDACLEGERNDQRRWRGEEHDGSLPRSRLRDRIRLPGATSFDRHGSRSEEWDRAPRGRLSPPEHSDLRGKLHERLKVRSAKEIPVNSVKSSVVKASSGEDAESLNFAGPKSLAELKAKKGGASSSQGEAIVKGVGLSRVTSGIISSREPAPFEGPKPLSAILKRKREVASEDAAAHFGSIQEEDNAAGVDEESQILADDTVEENMEGNTAAEEEGEEEAFHPEDDVAYDDNADEATGQELEEHQDVETAGEGEDYDYEAADTNAAAGQELEEHQDVEAAAEDYDYEANANAAAGQDLQDVEAAAEDYDYEAADINAEEDNEYQEYQDDDDDLEDDDDDDFARKVGVMIS